MMMQDLSSRQPQQHHHQHRKTMPTMTKNSAMLTRSSSLNKRPTTDLYTFQELNVKESGNLRWENFQIDDFFINLFYFSSYITSIEDVSSGYSSTLDLSSRSELSRASSNASLRSNKKSSRDNNMSTSVSSTLPRRRGVSEKKQMRATK